MEKRLEVRPEEEGQRLDRFLVETPQLSSTRFSRARVQGLIRSGRVLVNGRVSRASYTVSAGDEVLIQLPDPEPSGLQAESIPLDILYEDREIIVINKARGMVVHPAVGNTRGTLVNALLAHCADLEGVGGEARPGIVHRLDKDTTGAMVVAKTDRAFQSLRSQVKEYTTRRQYVAVVWGCPSVHRGMVDAPIGRHQKQRLAMAVMHDGRPAVTHFQVVEKFGGFSLLRLKLETGRTHQIRVHMSFIGHPIVGDPMYATGRDAMGMSGQALHAHELGFRHPASGEWVEFQAPLPDDTFQLIHRLRQRARERGEVIEVVDPEFLVTLENSRNANVATR